MSSIKNNSNEIILLIIIMMGAILRFWDYGSIPFTHDEFSALFRTDFNSFSELIEKGVKPDGHPAGVQVFYYYYIKFFGAAAWAVKLPFTIAGMLSVWLVYLIARYWYNDTVALICAAFISSTQYMVMYSQIARPYISGLFLVLAMVYFWGKLVRAPDKNFILNGLLFSLFAALSAYNHHFSLLFAAIVGVSGLFFIPRKRLLPYCAFGALVFVLYIPHLSIFFHQLSLGGVEQWLAKPKNDFIIDFLKYSLNDFIISYFMVFALIILGVFTFRKSNFQVKAFLLFLSWFAIPFLAGFFYSRHASAVLQYSVLIFSFPFLYLVMFGHITNLKPKWNFLLVLLILVTNIYGITVVRNHYTVFYQSPYEAILLDYQKAKSDNPELVGLIDSHEKITDYYMKKWDVEKDYLWFQDFTNELAFKEFLEEYFDEGHTSLYFGGLSENNPLTVPLIREFFPKIVWQNNYRSATTYLFEIGERSDAALYSKIDFDGEIPKGWSNVDSASIIDSISFSGNNAYAILNEFSISFMVPLDEIIDNHNNFIDVSAKVFVPDSISDMLLVATLESEGEGIFWGATAFKTLLAPADCDKWAKINFSVKLSDIDQDYNDIQFSTYFWNQSGRPLFIDEFSIAKRDGNPIIYGLLEAL